MPRTRAAIKEWRRKNRHKWNQAKARNYAKGALHQQNTQTEWTVSECEKITAPNRPFDRVLAIELGRTVRAIQVQRSKLNQAKQPTSKDSTRAPVE